MKNKNEESASDVLEGVVRDSSADYISFLEIKTSFHRRGFGLLMFFFALPIAILPPGLTLIPAVPLLLFSLQMLNGVDSPWLPKWIAKKTIQREKIALIVEKSSPYLKRAEKLLRPRFFFASSKNGEKIVGLFGLIFSLSVIVPLPFTNLLPAIGIIVMSLGLLSKDGFAIILGMVIGSMGVFMTLLVLFLGKKAVFGVIQQII